MQRNSTAGTHMLGSTADLALHWEAAPGSKGVAAAEQPLPQLGQTEVARSDASSPFVCPPAAVQQELVHTEAPSSLVPNVPHLTILNR